MATPLSPAKAGVLGGGGGGGAATKRTAAAAAAAAAAASASLNRSASIELVASPRGRGSSSTSSSSRSTNQQNGGQQPSTSYASFLPLSSSASIWRWAPQAGERFTRRTAPRYLALVALAAVAVAAGRWLVASPPNDGGARAAGLDRLTAGFLHGETLARLLSWAKENPRKGATAFAAVEAVAVAALVPASLFCLAAGSLFGSTVGGIASWVGLCAGQGIAFALGRTLLRSRVASWLAAAPPRWATIDAALAKGGWRLVVLLRLSPVVPWNLFNYACAMTGIGWRAYFAGSAAAVAPWAALFAHLGSLAASLADVLEGKASLNSNSNGNGQSNGLFGDHALVVTAAGAALVVAAVSYVVLLARRAVRDALRSSASKAEGGIGVGVGGGGGAAGAAAAAAAAVAAVAEELAPLEAEAEEEGGGVGGGGSGGGTENGVGGGGGGGGASSDEEASDDVEKGTATLLTLTQQQKQQQQRQRN